MIYHKEYHEVKRLMLAYVNMAMGDMRKLVYNREDLQLLSSKTKDFPILKEQLFIPYNEVIKSQKNQRQSIGQKSSNKSQKQPPVNQFYKFQSTNCEDFIGNRDFHLQMDWPY